MRKRYGVENVILTARKLPSREILDEGHFHFLDINDRRAVFDIVEREEIDTIVHLAALLSATAEVYRDIALEMQTIGFHNICDVGVEYDLEIFYPSSIAAFGPTTPLDETPDLTVQRPVSIYGAGKVYGEILGEYFAKKGFFDFRSLRYPGIISWKTLPGGGSTDFSVEMYHYAIKGEPYECYIGENEALPFMYMPDCVNGTIDFLEANKEDLTYPTYNVTAFSLTPKMIEESIKKVYPDFEVTYQPDSLRNPLVQSWPNSLDDSQAREDWNWDPEFDLDKMTEDMIENLIEHVL